MLKETSIETKPKGQSGPVKSPSREKCKDKKTPIPERPRQNKETEPSAGKTAKEFSIKNHCIYQGERQLTNFSAKIERQVTVHCGGGKREVTCVISGFGSDGEPLPKIKVLAHEVKSLTWIGKHWGIGPEILDWKDRALVSQAILALSGDFPKIERLPSPGYQRFNGQRVYVHANGAITKKGTDKAIRLAKRNDPDAFVPSWLDTAKIKEKTLVKSIQNALSLRDLSEESPFIGLMLLLAALRPLLGHILPVDASLFLVGRRETFKTSAAKLSLGFFNPKAADSAPFQWSSTANGLLKRIEEVNYGALVIDDFVHGTGKRAEFADKAEKVLRGAANGRGPDRYHNGSSRRVDTPLLNAFVISTGEMIPEGSLESLHARIIHVPVEGGDVDPDHLKKFQTYAAAGDFNRVAATFTHFLLSQDEKALKGKVQELLNQYRGQGADKHELSNRRAGLFASLMVTWECFLEFCLVRKALAEDEREIFLENVREDLTRLLEMQDSLVGTKKTKTVVCEALAKGLKMQRFFVLDPKTVKAPKGTDPVKCGLKGQKSDTKTMLATRREDLIGWYDVENKHLYVDSNFDVGRIIACMPPQQQKLFSRSKNKFWKDMKGSRVLAIYEGSHNTVRRKFGGQNKPSNYYAIQLDLGQGVAG